MQKSVCNNKIFLFILHCNQKVACHWFFTPLLGHVLQLHAQYALYLSFCVCRMLLQNSLIFGILCISLLLGILLASHV